MSDSTPANIAKPMASERLSPYGFGGWLIVFGVFLVYRFVRDALYLGLDFIPLFSDKHWTDAVTPGGANYDPMWKPVIYTEGASVIAGLVLVVLLIVLVLRKSRFFPGAAAFLLLIKLAAAIALFFMYKRIPALAIDENKTQSIFAVVQNVIFALAWIPYLYLSHRVKNTYRQAKIGIDRPEQS